MGSVAGKLVDAIVQGREKKGSVRGVQTKATSRIIWLWNEEERTEVDESQLVGGKRVTRERNGLAFNQKLGNLVLNNLGIREGRGRLTKGDATIRSPAGEDEGPGTEGVEREEARKE